MYGGMKMSSRVKQYSAPTPYHFLCFCFCCSLLFFFSFQISSAQNATTDPSEAKALNAIFQQWDAQAASSWNTSGELCTGSALDETLFLDGNNNPAILCDCTYDSGSTCHITQLSIALNTFYGPIPKELGNLKELTSLSLGHNNFSGTLPPELGNLVKLREIYLDSSGLGGEFPSTFAELQNMEILVASDTPLSGKIPEFVGNWTRLKRLRFQGNSFEGPIPSSFSMLISLNSLRISDLYNVSSSLDFITSLKDLTDLVLRNALISGTIPSNIGEHQSLKILDLSFNNLTGRIPSALFNMSSLTYVFLGNNSLSGPLPSQKSEMLQNIDLSYNDISGSFPSWVTTSGLQLNLVANNFTFGSSNISTLPGLNCLQKSFLCNRNSPRYANFSIKCGDRAMITADGTVYEAENASLGAASFYVTSFDKWAVSNVGQFSDRQNTSYVENTLAQVTGTTTPELFQNSRISPGSLRYYGLGLQNGPYTVRMLFAETGFADRSSQSWKSLGRRVFDIYIQGSLQQKDFDISEEAGGVERALEKVFNATVSENYLEVHLFWAGKGTCCIPVQGYYGPMISALRAISDFPPTVSGIPPSTSKGKNRTGLVVGIAVSVGVVSSILIVAVCFMKRKSDSNDEEEFLGIGPRPNTYSYAELRSATEEFIPSNKLGEGGFGPVYKGTLSDGRVVAVKQLSVASHQGRSQFIAEIATISAVQHRNLVKLYGCCIEGDKRLLVYEYLENKSLDQALFGKNDLNIDWPTRFSICIGTAKGLAYLHEESRPRIVHRDVKASNILLDAELCPKISDFGLAKLYDDKITHISTRVAGTIGYLAPEYAMRGHLTEKADVFGFGVVALEILSGRPNSDNSLDTEKIYLLEWAWTLHEHNQALGLVDPKLLEFDENEATRVIGVALLCTQASPMMRPPMSRVVAMLTGDIEVGTVTTKPSYLTDLNFKDITSSFLDEGDTMLTASSSIKRQQKNQDGNPADVSPTDPTPSPMNVTKSMVTDIIGEGR
ncbi:probable LRR receptor-like serine/threonine-protein kinase At1g56130 isoform X2 [Juglans microcarpa x Juglans regia]|uniref:probable LRR receptor-like serine/threonine-protein kinase At1g56130 isoform X2 n=1 Tax=Juglans microcarpa x Juglans regia TaxID=2249226 RepID=UPI001B7E0AFB|nr:probable LRR receptor-like serine/threonine-protein kinase At1g56130 isoform X2 [Juglans microcarpa x Juglans regia]